MSQKKSHFFSRILILFLAISSSVFARNKVIYGEDNRKDVFESTNALHKSLARSTAAMVHKRQIGKNLFGLTLNFSKTLETGANVCPNEKFAQQPIGAMCSAFLVAPDILVTAGHCFDLRMMGFPTAESVCQNFSWVFNYAKDSSYRNPLDIGQNDVYNCKRVIKTTLNQTQDFAVIQLDRAVVGKSPVKYRNSGKVSDRAPLVVIGHPNGLPSKITDNGNVINNTHPTLFVTNLDTFQGNSGSAVFDSKTGLVEGILIQGKTDYTPSISSNDKSCLVVNRCLETGLNCADDPKNMQPGPHGEVVLRITELSSIIDQVKNQSRLISRK